MRLRASLTKTRKKKGGHWRVLHLEIREERVWVVMNVKCTAQEERMLKWKMSERRWHEL